MTSTFRIPFLHMKSENDSKFVFSKVTLFIDYPVERCKNTVILHVAKSIQSLKRLKQSKPWYGPSPFSLICSPLLKALSLIFG